MSYGIGKGASGLLDALSDIDKPQIKELSRKLKRYIEAEKTILRDLDAAITKGSALEAQCRGLKDWAKNKGGADAEAFKKREKDITKAMDALGSFTDAIESAAGGKAAGKSTVPGDAIQAVLDKLEFSDKATVKDLRDVAKAYYPAESAAVKRLQEWVVHLDQLLAGLNDGLSALNSSDQVEALHIALAKKNVVDPAIKLQKAVKAAAP
jgi:hypothetical protein